MNTSRIDEGLRLTLGGEAAKSLAHTLGPMFAEAGHAVTKIEFRARLSSDLGRFLGRILERSKRLRNDEVLDAIKSGLDRAECDEVLRVDAITSGLVDRVARHVVVEVSSTGDTDDVGRAERRAAIPVVACEAISCETALIAHARGVHVGCNGTMSGAAGQVS